MEIVEFELKIRANQEQQGYDKQDDCPTCHGSHNIYGRYEEKGQECQELVCGS